jgi:D-galactarolactone cycloisomerase
LPTTSARIHVVEVHTDEGIVGVGSGGVPVRWEVAGLFLMGQDPFAIDQHVDQLRSMAFFIGRPWPVEVALWDIIGQATGQPVYRLLGGGADRLKAYASTGELRGLEARVESAQQIVSEGFKALKLRFHSADWREDIRTLEAVRKAVGDDIDIMVDANWGWRIAPDRQPNRWDPQTAIAAAREMERYGVYWLEEPLDAYDYDGLVELRSHLTTLRVAGASSTGGRRRSAPTWRRAALTYTSRTARSSAGSPRRGRSRRWWRRRGRCSRRTRGRTASAWWPTCT